MSAAGQMKGLIFWILVSKISVALIVLYSGIGLMPDEAQYWTWSKELSYGYYSKPPGIAWQIAFGTYFFGDTEFGVRFVSLVFSFFLSLGIYFLVKACLLDHKKAYWAALCFSYSPLGMLSGFFATTDCAYILFWTMACAIFVTDIQQSRAPSVIKLGVVLGLGALWKWPIYLLWLVIFLFSLKFWGKVLGGLLLSLLGLLPSFVWNLERGFPTFQHVAASIRTISQANPLEFIGAQVALASPLIFLLIVMAFLRGKSRGKSLHFCWWSTVLFFLPIFTASFFEKIQGNWAVMVYPTAFVVMASFASIAWMRRAVVVSLLLLVSCAFFPKIFIQGLGWQNIPSALKSSGYDPKLDFLFSDRYQATSLLSFYGPEKKRAYFFNIHGLRHNQYDFWPSMAENCVGKTGYLVAFTAESEGAATAERLKEKLKNFFKAVAILPPERLYKNKVAIILRCECYLGSLPQAPNKY